MTRGGPEKDMCHGEEVGHGPWGRDLGPIRLLRVFIGREKEKLAEKGTRSSFGFGARGLDWYKWGIIPYNPMQSTGTQKEEPVMERASLCSKGLP